VLEESSPEPAELVSAQLVDDSSDSSLGDSGHVVKAEKVGRFGIDWSHPIMRYAGLALALLVITVIVLAALAATGEFSKTSNVRRHRGGFHNSSSEDDNFAFNGTINGTISPSPSLSPTNDSDPLLDNLGLRRRNLWSFQDKDF
jgi:hypothetical protein